VFAGFRFPREVIAIAVRWHPRYGLPYQDVEQLPAERGITVDHVTACRRARRLAPEFTGAAGFCRHAPGDRWPADETYLKVAGRRACLYRAIDHHGQVTGALLSKRRGLAAARRFLARALRAGTIPAEVTTDRAPASAPPSTASRWPSDRPTSSVIALNHVSRSLKCNAAV
jgi:transposase-like protein